MIHLPGFPTDGILERLIETLIELFTGPASESMMIVIDALINAPFISLDEEWFIGAFAKTLAFSWAVSTLITLAAVTVALVKDGGKDVASAALELPKTIFWGMASQSIYIFGIIIANLLIDMAVELNPPDTDSGLFFNLNEGESIIDKVVLGASSYGVGFALRIEVALIQLGGYAVLLLYPITRSLLPAGRIPEWLHRKIVNLGYVSIFARPMMVWIIVIGSLIMENLPTFIIPGTAMFIGFFTYLVTAIAPVAMFSVGKRKLKQHYKVKASKGAGRTGAFLRVAAANYAALKIDRAAANSDPNSRGSKSAQIVSAALRSSTQNTERQHPFVGAAGKVSTIGGSVENRKSGRRRGPGTYNTSSGGSGRRTGGGSPPSTGPGAPRRISVQPPSTRGTGKKKPNIPMPRMPKKGGGS